MVYLKINLSPDFDFFRPKKNRQREILYPVSRKASMKDILESLGIPHTEIGQIQSEGEEVDFDFIPAEPRQFDILPIEAPFEVTQPSLLRPHSFESIRFVVDVNVGKLASLLRMLGFDAKYHPDLADKDIALIASQEKRIVLSRDTALFKRKEIVYGRHLRSVYPIDQLTEVIHFFGLKGPFDLFSLCLRCNQRLIPVDKNAILHRLEPKTKKYFTWFKLCPDCDKIYWKGSHYDGMLNRLKRAGIAISS